MTSVLRQRLQKGAALSTENLLGEPSIAPEPNSASRAKPLLEKHASPWTPLARAVLFLTIGIASVLRLWNIGHPSSVVFDEVHFGGFASHYLKREYYFDVHPPFGKMLIAGIAWLAGFQGNFGFSKIGESYIGSSVPYVWIRSILASCGAVSVALAYAALIEMNIQPLWAGVAAAMLALDTALIAQVRFILLDALMMVFMMSAVYCWIRFRRLRYRPFSQTWWAFLAATGTSIGAAMGVKLVGLFTVMSIGVATVIDLWQLAERRREMSDRLLAKHFGARVLCLAVLPLSIYIGSFYAHFSILTHAGPGDAFMSPAFQSNLVGNRMHWSSRAVRYGQHVRIKNTVESTYLHSHADRIPVHHEDGKVSSGGQQVNGYGYEDENNIWQILVPSGSEQLSGQQLKNGDIIRLKHKATGKVLLTHDVASALTRTNQEITAVDLEDEKQYPETLWKVSYSLPATGGVVSMATHFQLVTTAHNVYLNNHQKNLPQWGHQQRELNGCKRGAGKSSWWVFSDVLESIGITHALLFVTILLLL